MKTKATFAGLRAPCHTRHVTPHLPQKSSAWRVPWIHWPCRWVTALVLLGAPKYLGLGLGHPGTQWVLSPAHCLPCPKQTFFKRLLGRVLGLGHSAKQLLISETPHSTAVK